MVQSDEYCTRAFQKPSEIWPAKYLKGNIVGTRCLAFQKEMFLDLWKRDTRALGPRWVATGHCACDFLESLSGTMPAPGQRLPSFRNAYWIGF
jgi:hypothetical protein